MKKIVNPIMVFMMFSIVANAKQVDYFAHIDKTTKIVTIIDGDSTEKNDNDEILIIDEKTIRPNYDIPWKGKKICYTSPNDDDKKADKFCKSIFVETDVVSNTTVGIIGNVFVTAVTLGTNLRNGVETMRKFDQATFNSVVAGNNLIDYQKKVIEERIKAEADEFIAKENRKKDELIAKENRKKKEDKELDEMIKRAEAKRQEEIKVAEAKRQEEIKVAEAKRQEEIKVAETKRQKEQKVAETKRQEEIKVAETKRQKAVEVTNTENTLFEKVEIEVKDGFGDIKKQKICKVLFIKDERETAEYFAQTWKNPELFSTEYRFDSISKRVRADVALVSFEKFGNVDFNQINLQGEDFTLKSGLSQIAIYSSVENFCLDEKVKKKHIQLLQAYMAANKLITTENMISGCRYWPRAAQQIPVSIFNTLMYYKNTNKAAIKLLAILGSDKKEEEKIQIIMKQPNVSEMFKIISK